MKILGIESSAKAASVAICEDNSYIAQYYQASALTHSRTLLAMCEDILKNLDMSIADIDAVAVACGPGSFTGIRIGVAAAKGLAWGADKPVFAISTLEAMAYNCHDKNVLICPVMDARRSQVYNALFEKRNGTLARLCEDRAISLEELADDVKKIKKTVFLVGDGAELCYNFLVHFGVDCLIAPEPLRMQNAWGVCAACTGKTPSPADSIVPNYLRLSQAERERLEKSKQL